MDPPPEPQCHGEPALRAIIVVEWMAMGCFFLTIGLTVVLALDIDGVPNRLLPLHLEQSNVLFALPYASVTLGILLMPVGYFIDIGERLGCGWSIFGVCVGPMFVLAILGTAAWARRKRRLLRASAYESTGHKAAQASVHPLDPATREAAEPELESGGEPQLAEVLHGLLKTFQPPLGRSWLTAYMDRTPPNERLETFEEQLERGATAATPAPTGELLP